MVSRSTCLHISALFSHAVPRCYRLRPSLHIAEPPQLSLQPQVDTSRVLGSVLNGKATLLVLAEVKETTVLSAASATITFLPTAAAAFRHLFLLAASPNPPPPPL